ncbi:MAG: DUF1638 domain-containing protein [Kiritimatiellia bacterium]
MSSTPPAPLRVHVLACGVLAADLRALAPRIAASLTLDLLPGKLHNTPHDLRHRLQERIDAVSASGHADLIAIAYGVCGRGTVGLTARGIPLRIPRVHDCIALFLGSDAAYREQFGRFPGTYYVSAGWVEEGMGTGSACAPAERSAWEAQHGEENATAIADFFASWKKNYQRAAFIDTGIGNCHCADIARRMADENGWRYEALKGSHELLTALLSGVGEDRILQVSPGFTTQFDAASRCLTARPPMEQIAPAALVARARPEPGAAKLVNAQAPGPGRAGASFSAAKRASGRSGSVRRAGATGLGIDAGGTYTDAAIFDWGGNRVLAKAKAPTSHWDYAIGIDAALARLPEALLRQVSLVSVSTTLATNAIVEGKGQKVGLLLLPPMDDDDYEAHIHHRPVRTVQGRMGIDGVPLQDVDPDEICRVARALVADEDVRAFAVTGYASHVNPAHELQIMALLRATTGLPVTGGHEVSTIRNYRVRAETAALNARIIPCLQALMERLRDCLAARNIRAPLMVVRSDGTLMNLATALLRPVETLLSGPAASVAGARFLCELPDALIMDIGGTTSDTAVLHDGMVRTDPDGATVGHWRTHVKALAVRTLGLGGDSEIRHERQAWHVGPRRVTPICRLGENASATEIDNCLCWMESHRAELSEYASFGVYARLPTPAPARLTPRQQEILAVLARRPACAAQLVQVTGCHKAVFLEMDSLLENQLVRVFGFTPTDALHQLGRMAFWDAGLARRFAVLLGEKFGVAADELAQVAEKLVVRRVAQELLMTRLVDLTGTRSLEGDHGFVAKALLERGLGERRDALGVDLRLGIPVVGIGAPAAHFLPGAAQLLHTETVIPTDGDVANAIGAITSGIRVERRVEIHPDERGEFHVAGLAGAPVFADLAAAQAFAESALRTLVQELACQTGAKDPRVEIRVRDRVVGVTSGEELFLGRTIQAVASGEPG